MDTLFIYLLKSAGILAIFFLAYKCLLQKETFFNLNRHYLLGGIIASLLLPLVVFTSYVYVTPDPLETASFYDSMIAAYDTTMVEASPAFDWNSLLFKIYILGVIIVSTQFLIQLLSLLRILKSGTHRNHHSFKLIEVSDDVSPFSFFNYIIYNPDNFSEKDLEIILNHEKAHGKQLHTIDILCSQLFLIFQWFNPIVWLYKKTIQQNLEFLADKEAIAHIASKQNYQRTLLKVSVAPHYTSITNNFYNSLIKKRIVMLNQSSSKTRNLWKYSLILPALALFLVSFNTKTQEIVRAPENPVSTISESNDSNTFEPLEETPIPLVNDSDTPESPATEEAALAQHISIQNDVIAKITKDTTKEELDTIKRELRAKGMDFSYSNVDYNAANEITSIKIKYSDEGRSKTGSYHVNGDDDDPIKPIYIYTTENGGIGLGNSPDGREHKEHMRLHEERLAEHKERMEEHKERIYAHKLKMKEHNSTIKEEHEERMEEHREHMEERKAEMEEEHEKRLMEMKERHAEMEEEKEVHLKELKERMTERKARLKERKEVHMKERKEHLKERETKLRAEREERKKLRKRTKEGNTFIYTTDDGSSDSNTFVVQSSSSSNPAKISFSNGKKPLFIVDGKQVKEDAINTLDPNNITSVNVLKGDSAIALYGKKGKDGVVQIVTKGNRGSAVAFNNTSEKMYFIEKSTSDNLLKSFKRKLDKQGIDFNFSGIKRNKKGEITRIKLRLNDNKGSKTSSTYDTSPDPIPTIMLGKKGNKIMISSSK